MNDKDSDIRYLQIMRMHGKQSLLQSDNHQSKNKKDEIKLL